MAEIIVVTSGKGGVGKTTTSAAIGSGLAIRGHKTVIIDFDVGLRNLDLIMGCERRVVYDFVNVLNNEANLNQALIKDKRNDKLFILPASQTRDKDALTQEGVQKILTELAETFLHTLLRSEEHTSELQSRETISYDVFCLKKKKKTNLTQKSSHE